MAIAFSASSEAASTWLLGVSSMNLIHDINGSNRVLFVFVELYNVASLTTVSGITCDSTPLTKIDSHTSNLEGAWQDGELWYLDNPTAAGSAVIAVSLSGLTGFASAQAISYTGKTVAGIDASAKAQNLSASTTAPTNNVNVVHDDCWIVGGGYSRDGSTPSAGSGTTSRQTTTVGHIMGDSNGVVGTGNQTLAFSVGSAATWPAVISASFSAANSGGGAPSGGGPLFGGPTRSQLIQGRLVG